MCNHFCCSACVICCLLLCLRNLLLEKCNCRERTCKEKKILREQSKQSSPTLFKMESMRHYMIAKFFKMKSIRSHMIDQEVFILLLGYSMLSMFCLELSDGKRLRRKEDNLISKVSPSPIAHEELLKPTCQTHSY